LRGVRAAAWRELDDADTAAAPVRNIRSMIN
jgi:hypothetical protein